MRKHNALEGNNAQIQSILYFESTNTGSFSHLWSEDDIHLVTKTYSWEMTMNSSHETQQKVMNCCWAYYLSWQKTTRILLSVLSLWNSQSKKTYFLILSFFLYIFNSENYVLLCNLFSCIPICIPVLLRSWGLYKLFLLAFLLECSTNFAVYWFRKGTLFVCGT